jgi:hypothetical protein
VTCVHPISKKNQLLAAGVVSHREELIQCIALHCIALHCIALHYTRIVDSISMTRWRANIHHRLEQNYPASPRGPGNVEHLTFFKLFPNKLNISISLFTDEETDFTKNLSDPIELQATLDKYELKCEPCSAVFFTKSHLSKHNGKVHKVTLYFECETCHKHLGSKNDLKRHSLLIHRWTES